MVASSFQTANRLIYKSEKGYANHPDDPGGPTMDGVTKRTYETFLGRSVTIDELKRITQSEVEAIAKKMYWDEVKGDALPAGIDYAVADFAFNSGPSQATKTLQRLVGTQPDGILGAKTLEAVKAHARLNEVKLIRDYCNARMRFLKKLKNWSSFSRGWTIRVTGKDPKGEWAAQPGVVGDAIALAINDPVYGTEVPSVEAPQGKSPPSEVAPTSTPEGIGGLAGVIAGVLSAIAPLAGGEGPVQWALAACMVGGLGIAAYYFAQRLKSQ